MQEDSMEELKSAHLNILVAEDDDLSFSITQMLIERLTGTAPDRAINGIEAFDKVKSGDYDLVLMDHMMPLCNGIDATLKIRTEIQDWKQPVIIALSGSTTPMDLILFKKVGIDLFLAKPLRLAKLSEALMQVVHEGRSMITAPSQEYSEMLAMN